MALPRPSGATCGALGLAAALLALSPEARAQQNTSTAMVNVTPVSQPTALLTQEQRNREEGGRGPREYLLQWTTSNAGARSFRLSFDRDAITPTVDSEVLVPVLPPGSNNGVALNGTTSVRVSEDDLIERIRTSTNTQVFQKDGSIPIFILVYTPDTNPGDQNDDVARGEWPFQVDLVPPEAPPVVSTEVGERSLEIQWTRPANANDIAFYEVRHCPNLPQSEVERIAALDDTTVADPSAFPGTVDPVYVTTTVPCDANDQITRENIQPIEDTLSISEGIEEDSYTAFAVLATDEAPFFNRTETPLWYLVRTVDVADFFERQQELGGGEDGGFCFVATAAHGSYAHPTVAALRFVRDELLGRLPFGRALTRAYYEVSPPLAAAIDGRPGLAAAARVVLLGLTVGVFLAALALAGLLGAVVFFLTARGRAGVFLTARGREVFLTARGRAGVFRAARGRAGRRRGQVGAGAAAGFFVLTLAGSAEAQDLRPIPSGVGVAFQVEAGPFLPALAQDPASGGLAAWDDVYGSGRTRVLVNVGGEIQLLRGDFGTVSVGGTVGFIAWEGRALRIDDNGFLSPGASGSSTFNLVPMTLTAGYRLDAIMDYTPVPLAPYVRGGLAYGLWWNNRDDGSLSRIDAGGEERTAIGGKPGLTATLGLALSLNAVDSQGATQLYATTGIRATYLYFEGQTMWMDGFGDEGFDLSESLTWFGGLMLEL